MIGHRITTLLRTTRTRLVVSDEHERLSVGLAVPRAGRAGKDRES